MGEGRQPPARPEGAARQALTAIGAINPVSTAPDLATPVAPAIVRCGDGAGVTASASGTASDPWATIASDAHVRIAGCLVPGADPGRERLA